jgi:hypothetical protein
MRESEAKYTETYRYRDVSDQLGMLRKYLPVDVRRAYAFFEKHLAQIPLHPRYTWFAVVDPRIFDEGKTFAPYGQALHNLFQFFGTKEKFKNNCPGLLGEDVLMDRRSIVYSYLVRMAESQTPYLSDKAEKAEPTGVLFIPAQFGSMTEGKSADSAMMFAGTNDVLFPLDVMAGLSMIMTHPERLVVGGPTVVCPGSMYRPDGSKGRDFTPRFVRYPDGLVLDSIRSDAVIASNASITAHCISPAGMK